MGYLSFKLTNCFYCSGPELENKFCQSIKEVLGFNQSNPTRLQQPVGRKSEECKGSVDCKTSL